MNLDYPYTAQDHLNPDLPLDLSLSSTISTVKARLIGSSAECDSMEQQNQPLNLTPNAPVIKPEPVSSEPPNEPQRWPTINNYNRAFPQLLSPLLMSAENAHLPSESEGSPCSSEASIKLENRSGWSFNARRSSSLSSDNQVKREVSLSPTSSDGTAKRKRLFKTINFSKIIPQETEPANHPHEEILNKLRSDSNSRYQIFRKAMLNRVEGNANGTNANMRRAQNNMEKYQDPEYLEKRRKNNEAAKRSRDLRRKKLDEIMIRVEFLEQENVTLECKLQAETDDLMRIQQMVSIRKDQRNLQG